MRGRGFAAQQTEAAIGVAVLNRMLAAGRPDSVRSTRCGFSARSDGIVQRLGRSCRHSKYRLWVGKRFKSMANPRTERSVVDRTTNLEQEIGASPGPSHLLRLVHSPINQEVRRAFGDRYRLA
jgi:hypothetical protein